MRADQVLRSHNARCRVETRMPEVWASRVPNRALRSYERFISAMSASSFSPRTN